MRNAGQPDGDGPQNLRDAFAGRPIFRSARAWRARRGGRRVHAARWVTKTDSQAIDTFRSPGHGPLGHVDGEGVHFESRT